MPDRGWGKIQLRVHERMLFSGTSVQSGSGPMTRTGLIAFAGVGRFHITVIAALGAFTFGWLFTGKYPWLVSGVCALDWFIVNLINRVVDLREDRAGGIEGTDFIEHHRKPLLALGGFLLFGSLPVVHLLVPEITGLRIAGHCLGLLYNLPLLPGKRRLKTLFFFKNIASGTGFMITVFGYPLAAASVLTGDGRFPAGICWTTVGFSAVFFLLFTQSYEVIYDLRDAKGDAVAGVRTYPVVFGKQAAVHIAEALIASSILVLAAGYLLAYVPWRIFIMTAAPVIQLILFKRAVHRGISAKACIRMTWVGVLLLGVYHLWVAAGLPGANR